MLDAGFMTLLDLKQRLLPMGSSLNSDWDSALQRLGLGVAGRMNAHCNRVFQRVEGQVDEFNASTRSIVLRAMPVETIDSVEIRGFTGAVDDFTGGYQLDQRAGLMLFQSIPGDGTERIVVTYDGGFWLAGSSGAQPAGSTMLPYEIEEAFVMQCQAWAAARNIFGSVGISDDKKSTAGAMALSDEVKTILEPYIRYSGE